MEKTSQINAILVWGQCYTTLVSGSIDDDSKFVILILEYFKELEHKEALRKKILKRETAKWALKNLNHYKSSSLSRFESLCLQQQQQQQQRFLIHLKHSYSPLKQVHVSQAAHAAAIMPSMPSCAKDE
jgi:hypothetical protein